MISRLTALCAATCAAATCVAVAAPTPAGARHRPDAGPPVISPADIRFRPAVLRPGTPEQVGLLPGPIERIAGDVESYLDATPDHPGHPAYAAAAVLAAKDGVVVRRMAAGLAVRYGAVGPPPERAGVELPPDQQIPARPDTIFDLASVSKLFTAIAAMQQVERGRLHLDAPVARYVPEFGAGGKAAVTVRMLLTHTSGLPAYAPLWSAYPDPTSRLAAALAWPLDAGVLPGDRYLYSDLGLIALGVVVERVAGRPLDEVVAAGISGPLGMRDTGYAPDPRRRARVAATEYQPYAGRGMVWGEVHDENAWALGGVAGHAGVFSTVDDLAVLCQTLLNGGRYRHVRILRESTVRAMLANENAGLEAAQPESDRGLGFELNKHWYMDALASPVTFGHTGFTGTSLVIDPLSRSFVILLTNRVHPDRGWGGNNGARRAVGRDLADAMPVRPPGGGTAWRAQRRDGVPVHLTAALPAPVGVDLAGLTFRLWYDTEPRYDTVQVLASGDGGGTWHPVVLRLASAAGRWTAEAPLTGYGGRRWWRVTAALPAGTTHVRWTYATDGTAQGRGVYVDHVLVGDGHRVVFDGERRDADRLHADGWAPSAT